ncbi:unconventional myosin-Vb-like [Schistocerca americana]|uniref:unconventional myosin-Vb-like n=1 Tax=Schistocerca americana TaxID=7009 RepID=UPI001F4FECC5|nr:unconventional myosin-Vb-like [Schistocerca americana]
MGHLQWHGHSKTTHQCSFYSPITVSAQDKTISSVSEHGEDTEGVQLVLRLHQKVNEMEKERIELQKQVEESSTISCNLKLTDGERNAFSYTVLQEKLDLAKEELSQCKNSLKLQTEVLKDAGSTIYTIEKVTKKGHDDIDIMVLWLSNTVRLLHNLKQYSGDKTFQTENTSLQNEQCLQNFDLTEYREVLSDTAVEIYQSLAGHIQEKIQPLVVPATLEHEEISGLTSQRVSGKRGRAVLSSWDSEPFLGVRKSLDALLQELNYIYKIMGNHGVDPELTVQIFRQVFYFICAISMNNLLLRKDLCHWSTGMQIRYNLSHLEQWCRDMRLQYTDVPTTLQPIIQAAHLLQARKLDEDVQHVCNMCDKLSMLQIIKILNLYTTIDESEECVPVSFICRIQAKLLERSEPQKQATLLMDTKFMFPVRFPFNPSKIKLEDIEVPEVLNLPMLKKV